MVQNAEILQTERSEDCIIRMVICLLLGVKLHINKEITFQKYIICQSSLYC